MEQINHFEERGRSRKIGKIVPVLRRRRIPWEVVESYTEAQWAAVAKIAGVSKPPSETSRRRIVRILMDKIQLDRVAA